MKKYPLGIVFLLFASLAVAQFDHEDVFPNIQDQELNELLVENYKPATVLTYGKARDTMFLKIYNIDDSVSGIYSDHTLYLDPTADPTTFLYMDGIANGINTEHSYPQSKGAEEGNGRSDMHHLFPSRTSTNEERGSMPFGEVNDNSTQKWFYKTEENTTKPSADKIDLYSEKGNNAWEPREMVKGDIARAIFYFYTMYRDAAVNADPEFFPNQQDVLCEWHYLDPVDSLEWVRNKLIAKWQDDKANPFILDCSLAARLYCPEISLACQTVDVEDQIQPDVIRLLQNPLSNTLRLGIDNSEWERVQIHVFEASSGKQVLIQEVNMANSQNGNQAELQFDVAHLSPGVYVVRAVLNDRPTPHIQALKFVKIN